MRVSTHTATQWKRERLMLFLVRIISFFVSRHTHKKTHTSLLLLSFSSLSCARPHMYTHTHN